MSLSLVPQVPAGNARWNQMATYTQCVLLQERDPELRKSDSFIMGNKDVIFLIPEGETISFFPGRLNILEIVQNEDSQPDFSQDVQKCERGLLISHQL